MHPEKEKMKATNNKDITAIAVLIKPVRCAFPRDFLRGVEIDYVERPTGASFVFNNAFSMTGGSGTCGACGSAGGGCA